MESKTIKLKKTIIDIYDPQIYSTKLYISKKWDKKDILDRFESITEEDLENVGKGTIFFQYKDKVTNKNIALILINEDEHDCLQDKINTIAHECSHYSLCLSLYIGSNNIITEQEPFCYVLGWATMCAYKTLTK